MEEEIKKFFETHSTLDGWDFAHELAKKYNIKFEDAFMAVSHYLSKCWGVG